jgi:hypothetical protein
MNNKIIIKKKKKRNANHLTLVRIALLKKTNKKYWYGWVGGSKHS